MNITVNQSNPCIRAGLAEKRGEPLNFTLGVMNSKRQKRTVGSILAVPLGDSTTCFALALPDADFAFFDVRANECTFPAELLSKPVLFQVGVHKSAYNNGRWLKVGKVEVPSHLLEARPMFIQDALHPDRFEIYLAGNIRPASRQECEGLDRAAIWEPEHVEDRLRDHYAGVPNKWVELLRLK